MKKHYDGFGSELTMGAHVLESNSSGNLTPAVSEPGTVLPGYLVVILSVLMITLVVVIVAGNALVIMAFIVDKTLRTQSNYFFLNLAISDFLVGEFLAFCSSLCHPLVSHLAHLTSFVLFRVNVKSAPDTYCDCLFVKITLCPGLIISEFG